MSGKSKTAEAVEAAANGDAKQGEIILAGETTAAAAIENFGAVVQSGYDALAAANDDIERIMVRDEAAALAAAAAVLEKREIQVLAANLVAEAEREVVKHNPRKQGTRTDLELVAPGGQVHSVPKRDLSKMRAAHNAVTDSEFAELKRRALETREPLTRQAIRRAGGNGGGARQSKSFGERAQSWIARAKSAGEVEQCLVVCLRSRGGEPELIGDDALWPPARDAVVLKEADHGRVNDFADECLNLEASYRQAGGEDAAAMFRDVAAALSNTVAETGGDGGTGERRAPAGAHSMGQRMFPDSYYGEADSNGADGEKNAEKTVDKPF